MNWCICWFFTHIFLGILIFKGLTTRCLYKSFGVNGLRSNDIWQLCTEYCAGSVSSQLWQLRMSLHRHAQIHNSSIKAPSFGLFFKPSSSLNLRSSVYICDCNQEWDLTYYKQWHSKMPRNNTRSPGTPHKNSLNCKKYNEQIFPKLFKRFFKKIKFLRSIILVWFVD
jgi:hypothetical protein